jgi:hypothetical protein
MGSPDFAKISIGALYSDESSYSDPVLDFKVTPYEISPDEHISARIGFSTSLRYLGYGTFANSVDCFAIKNISTSTLFLNWYSLRGTTVLGSGHTLTFNNSAKTIVLSGSAAPDLTLAASGIEKGCWIDISGAGLHSSNQGLKMVSAVVAATITLDATETLSDEAVVSLTVVSRQSNRQSVPPGGIALMPEAVNSLPIAVISASGSGELEYLAIGT